MTNENCRANVRMEYERAASARQAVELLTQAGLWNEAVSRAYYAMFYMARALVFSIGLETRTHGGLIHLLSLHFVRSGRFPAELVRSFSQMQQTREDADYQSAAVFDSSAAVEARDRMRRFCETVEGHLRAEGFLAD